MHASKQLFSASLIAGLSACQPADEAFFAGELAERSDPSSAMSTYARDLAVSIDGPATAAEGATEAITITVDNSGSRNARNVSLAIELDSSVSVSGYPSRCSLSGSTLTCDLRRIRSGADKSVSFDVTVPSGDGTYTIDAEASTSDADGDASNNTDLLEIVVAADLLEIAGGDTLYAAVCFSSTAISWSDCTASSGLAYAALTFNADGSMALLDPTVDGTWTQDSAGTLDLEFRSASDSSLMSTFSADPVDDDCVEGAAVYSSFAGYGGWSGCLSGYPSP